MRSTSTLSSKTTAIAPYTQDGYRQLCERLDDDTVAALLHAHIRAFAADGNRQRLNRLTEAMRIAGEMEFQFALPHGERLPSCNGRYSLHRKRTIR